MIKAKLVVVGGDAKASEVDLTLPTVIGRSRDVTLTLPHPLVSRRHTELFEQDGYLFVKDLGSLNGTYVNNRRIDSAQRLKPNELLTLGNVTFRALYDADIVEADVIDDLVVVSRDDCSGDTQNCGDEKDETVTLGRADPSHHAGDHQGAGDHQVAPPKTGAVRCNESSARKPLKSVPTQSSVAATGTPVKTAAAKIETPQKSETTNCQATNRVVPKGLAAKSVADSGFNSNQASSAGSLDSGGSGDNKAKAGSVCQDADPRAGEDFSIFSSEKVDVTPEKSISVSALESLPPVDPSISVIDSDLNFDGRDRPSSIDLDADGDRGDSDSSKSDVALGSFLKKLPR